MIGLEFVKRATSGDLNNDTTTGYYFINTWSGHINGPASVNGIGALLQAAKQIAPIFKTKCDKQHFLIKNKM